MMMPTPITREAVTKIYVATFNRAPDAQGLNYWTYDSSLVGLEEIAMSFFDQSETQALYVPTMNTSEKITLAYRNLFNRDPDALGLAYWIEQIDSGAIHQSAMLLALINGAQSYDALTIQHKMEVGLYFADQGLNDIVEATLVLDNVSEISQSVTSSFAYIDSLVSNDTSNLYQTALLESHTLSTLGDIANLQSNGVSALDSGGYWEESPQISYSFLNTIPALYETATYASDCSLAWTTLSSAQKSSVRSIFSELENIIAIDFVETSSDIGDLRFSVVQTGENVAGFSYLPVNGGISDIEGDVFLSTDFNDATSLLYDALSPGEEGWHTIIHEIGHSLGLKHPFEDGVILPASEDDIFHSVMSYSDGKSLMLDVIFSNNNAQFTYTYTKPLFYSLYDISALHALYGANTSYATDDTTYTVDSSIGEIKTLWDAGGEDTIDASLHEGQSIVYLEEGTFSSIGMIRIEDWISQILDEAHANNFNNDDGLIANIETYADELYTGENNLAIAYGTIIENAMTGSGNDQVYDNEVNNSIATGAGDDSIFLGAGGWDAVDGGSGEDILFLDISYTHVMSTSIGTGTYRIIGDDFAADIENIENVVFNDNVIRDATFLSNLFFV